MLSPLQVSRLASASATRPSGSSASAAASSRPGAAERRRRRLTHQGYEFLGIDREAMLGIHLPDETQRPAAPAGRRLGG